MKNKLRLYTALAALFFLLSAAAYLLDKLSAPLPDRWGGLLVGGGVGVGVFFLSKALTERYYVKNQKARRMMEVEDRDERTRTIRGMAAYRALVSGTPIFLAVWLILLFLDVPLAGLLVVCAGYLLNFGVYAYHLVKLQKEM